MKYLLRPALRFPRAVDVPSALSMNREYQRDLMLDVPRKWCRSAKHSSGRAPHGHSYVNWFWLCVTACNSIRGLISKRRLHMRYQDACGALNPVWYMKWGWYLVGNIRSLNPHVQTIQYVCVNAAWHCSNGLDWACILPLCRHVLYI